MGSRPKTNGREKNASERRPAQDAGVVTSQSCDGLEETAANMLPAPLPGAMLAGAILAGAILAWRDTWLAPWLPHRDSLTFVHADIGIPAVTLLP
jgi:hypothetical protein